MQDTTSHYVSVAFTVPPNDAEYTDFQVNNFIRTNRYYTSNNIATHSEFISPYRSLVLLPSQSPIILESSPFLPTHVIAALQTLKVLWLMLLSIGYICAAVGMLSLPIEGLRSVAIPIMTASCVFIPCGCVPLLIQSSGQRWKVVFKDMDFWIPTLSVLLCFTAFAAVLDESNVFPSDVFKVCLGSVSISLCLMFFGVDAMTWITANERMTMTISLLVGFTALCVCTQSYVVRIIYPSHISKIFFQSVDIWVTTTSLQSIMMSNGTVLIAYIVKLVHRAYLSVRRGQRFYYLLRVHVENFIHTEDIMDMKESSGRQFIAFRFTSRNDKSVLEDVIHQLLCKDLVNVDHVKITIVPYNGKQTVALGAAGLKPMILDARPLVDNERIQKILKKYTSVFFILFNVISVGGVFGYASFAIFLDTPIGHAVVYITPFLLIIPIVLSCIFCRYIRGPYLYILKTLDFWLIGYGIIMSYGVLAYVAGEVGVISHAYSVTVLEMVSISVWLVFVPTDAAPFSTRVKGLFALGLLWVASSCLILVTGFVVKKSFHPLARDALFAIHDLQYSTLSIQALAISNLWVQVMLMLKLVIKGVFKRQHYVVVSSRAEEIYLEETLEHENVKHHLEDSTADVVVIKANNPLTVMTLDDVEC
eukprot:PhF_6_TR36564/c0_g1_i4/m.53997